MIVNLPVMSIGMRKYCFIVFSTLVCWLFPSCNPDDEYLNPIAIDGKSALSIGDYNMVPSGETILVAFTADVNWTLSGLDEAKDWLTSSVTSGKKGTTTFRIYAPYNSSGAKREAKLTFIGSGIKKSFVISQDVPYLYIATDSIYLHWDFSKEFQTKPQKMAIQSNINWKLVLDDSFSSDRDLEYYTLSEFRTRGDSVLSILPESSNLGAKPINTYFKIVPIEYDEDGNETEINPNLMKPQRVHLFHKNLRFLLNDSTAIDSVVINPLNTGVHSVVLEAEADWNIRECPAWVKIGQTPVSGSSTKTLLDVSADGVRQERTEQKGRVRISLKNYSVHRDFYVVQRGYELSIDSTSLTYDNGESGGYGLVVHSSGAWQLENIPSWLQVTSDSGNGDSKVHFTCVEQNLDLQDLTNTITLKSLQNSLSASLMVTQKKFNFEVLSPNANVLADLPTLNTTKYSLLLNISGDWEISDIPSWVSVSQNSGSKGAYTLLVGANSANPNMDASRSCTLVLKSLVHQGTSKPLTYQIPISQRKFIYEVSTSDFGTIPAYKRTFPTYSAVVKCSGNWSISSCPAWLTPNITSGDGLSDATIVFTPEINTSSEPRSGAVSILSKVNSETKTIAISQHGFVFDMPTTSYSNLVPYKPETFTLPITMTDEASWSISKPAWATFSAVQGSGSSNVMINVTDNLTQSARQGNVVVTSAVTGESKQFSISQDPYQFNVDVNSFTASELSTSPINIHIVCSGPWQINDVPNWLTFSPSSGTGNAMVEMTPMKNTSLSARSASVKVKSIPNNMTHTIACSQSAFRFDATPETYNLEPVPATSDDFHVSVYCSGAWSASYTPGVTLSMNNGQGLQDDGVADDVVVSVRNNLNSYGESYTIRFISDDDASHVKTVTVHRSAFVFALDQSAWNLTSSASATQTIKVSCSAGWGAGVAGHNVNWLRITSENGIVYGNGFITLEADENNSTETRTATVIVTSLMTSPSINFTVTQPGKKDSANHVSIMKLY